LFSCQDFFARYNFTHILITNEEPFLFDEDADSLNDGVLSLGDVVLLPEEELPDTKVLVLEGSYCNLPALRKHADLRLFLDTPGEVREARLLARESAASMQRFRDLWIPLENAYFEAYRLPDEDCIVIHADPAETGVS